ncbi:MAG: hypothetical protein AAF725_18550 [Acidobacteriota bacterium]
MSTLDDALMADNVTQSAPSLQGPWLALLIFAIPVATIGALCSLVAPWWVIHVQEEAEGTALRATLEQRWLFVVPVRSRDLGTLHGAELTTPKLVEGGAPRIGGGDKKLTYRLTLHHGKERITELAAGPATATEKALQDLVAGRSSPPQSLWVGKRWLGLWLPLLMLSSAGGLVGTFLFKLLRERAKRASRQASGLPISL